LTLSHLHCFVTEQNKNFILRVSIQEFSGEKPQDILTSRGKKYSSSIKFNPHSFPKKIGKFLLLPSDYSIACPIQTSEYLNHLCSNHQSYPLLITFHLINRLSNKNSVQLHILSTNDNDNEKKTPNNQEEFTNLLMSLSLSLPSNRQKQSFHLSK